MLFKLTTPVKFDNETLKEINLDLEVLSELDLDLAERQFRMLNPDYIGVVETARGYWRLVASVASKKPVDFFEKLSARDGTRLKFQVMGFLMDSSSTTSKLPA